VNVYLVLDAIGDWQPLHVASTQERADAWVNSDLRENDWGRTDHYTVIAVEVDGEMPNW
jgi:hypothetical protein